jgi:hypothetical protein
MLNVTAVGTFNVANGLITGVLNDGSNEVLIPCINYATTNLQSVHQW